MDLASATHAAEHGFRLVVVGTGGPDQRRGAVLGGRRPTSGRGTIVAEAPPFGKPSQPEGKNRTDGHCPPGVVEEIVRDGARRDDRIAPVIELDQLGQQLGAHPVPVAGDPVDGEGRASSRSGHQAARPRRAPLVQVRDRSWRSKSSAKDPQRAVEKPDRAVGVLAGAAAGELPGPADEAVEIVPVAGRREASRAAASEIERSPKTHGPHWAALWPAM